MMVEQVDEKKEEIKELHREGLKDGITFTPAEEAAAKFTYLLPVFKRALGQLSAKAAARVAYRLAEFPFGDSLDINKMGFTNRAEKQLFHIFYEINDAKRIMMQELEKQNAEKLGEEKKEDGAENKEQTLA